MRLRRRALEAQAQQKRQKCACYPSTAKVFTHVRLSRRILLCNVHISDGIVTGSLMRQHRSVLRVLSGREKATDRPRSDGRNPLPHRDSTRNVSKCGSMLCGYIAKLHCQVYNRLLTVYVVACCTRPTPVRPGSSDMVVGIHSLLLSSDAVRLPILSSSCFHV
jgi:hypothetical protein